MLQVEELQKRRPLPKTKTKTEGTKGRIRTQRKRDSFP